MKAILLAAGLGSRLGPLTRDIPKAIIEVSARPLIHRVIAFTRCIGVEEIIVVGGCNSARLWKALRDETVVRIDNPDYEKGNLYSLAAAADHIDDDFVLLNIDHLYPTHLARMVGETPGGVWAVADFDRPLYQDDMKIRVKGDLFKNAALSAISKELGRCDGGYCGVTVVRGEGLADYRTAFENVMGHGREQAVVEDVHAELIRLGKPSRVLDISGIRWLEIDTQEDLANAERIMRMKPHFLD